MKKNLFDSFMKIIVAVIICHGILCITASYILAFMGRDMIAESLSETVVREIIAPLIAYAIKSCIENVSKYNGWVKTIVDSKMEDEE